MVVFVKTTLIKWQKEEGNIGEDLGCCFQRKGVQRHEKKGKRMRMPMLERV